jgi:hypothetical protein
MRRVSPRLICLAGIGLAAAAFLLVPQAAAAAATAHSGTNAPAAIKAADRLPGSLAASPSAAAASCSNGVCTANVSPRLALSGCSREEGFNGVVQWDSASVGAWGQVWDVCGTTASVWLHWYSPNVHNSKMGQASAFTTNGVYFPQYGGIASPGHISVTVCAFWNGWECGTPFNV